MSLPTNKALFGVIFLCLFQSSFSATLQSFEFCNISGELYAERAQFKYEAYPRCFVNCTCTIKDSQAHVNCSKRCNAFSYPRGCTTISDSCGCPYKYVCPQGDKCLDSATNLLHSIGEIWMNNTCICQCLGQQKGAYQCQCVVENNQTTKALNSSTDIKIQNPCIPDKNVMCHGCDNADIQNWHESCPPKQKCDEWPFRFKRDGKTPVGLTCTCYGPSGYAKCISLISYVDQITALSQQSERKKRWASLSNADSARASLITSTEESFQSTSSHSISFLINVH